jgi:molybdopterin molybdotransferase
VSAFVGFELFVRPALRAMMGRSGESDEVISGTLTNDFKTKNDRPTYHPATLSSQGVSATQWAGSADLRSLLTANALLVLPAGDVSYKAGQSVSMIPIK